MSISSSTKSLDESKPVAVINESLSKSILDSLNMELEDGKPKFKLNEPAFSTINAMKCSNNLIVDNDDDDTSFIVLGKNSMDSINLASLLDYEQIQQKSMNIDYNSIISTLSHEEIESKVAQLLQENVKLKETLNRNNDAMKQQFNTLINWQNELVKVHANHKQKFTETCDMISYLKKENAELKEKLSVGESLMASKFSGEIVENSLTQKNAQSLTNPPTIDSSIVDVNKDNNLTPMNSIASNIQELTTCNCEENESKNCKSIRERQERDLHYQQEIISSVKKQLHKLNENSFLCLQLQMENSLDRPSNKNGQQFFEHYTYYNQNLNDLAKCYAEQTTRFISIQDCLKRCIDTLDIYRSHNQETNIPQDKIIDAQKILESCRLELIDEQLINVTERQNLIKTQNQFQKIFSDYNSTLHELEILREKNVKPSQHDYQLEKEKEELSKKLGELENERKQIQLEQKNMEAERLLFDLEKENLNEQKASLNSQGVLYEAQIKSYNDELKPLHKERDELKRVNEKLEADVENKDIELQGIRARLQLAKNDADTMTHLHQQLEIYESDFQDERRRKQDLIQEREQLTEQLAKLRNHNQNLLRTMNGPNPAPVEQGPADQIAVDAFCTECGLYKMPGQWHGPGWCQPID